VAELVCCQCGYALAGLAPEGVCPECGRAIAESIRALERGGVVEFYERVGRGACWAGAGGALLAGGLLELWGFPGRWGFIGLVMGGIGLMLWWCGWWVLGTRLGRVIDDRSRAGDAIRSCIALQAFGATLIVLTEIGAWDYPGFEMLEWLGFVFACVSFVLHWSVGFFWVARGVDARAPGLGALCRGGALAVLGVIFALPFGVEGIVIWFAAQMLGGAVVLLLVAEVARRARREAAQ
jgi:hypothetical protein